MPAYTYQAKEQNVEYARNSNHCATCLNLNGCCFPKNKMPLYPHHYGCHCYLEPAVNLSFSANCREDKFTVNIFNPREPNGKIELFEELGYGIIDVQILIDEYCHQAKEKYSNGEFELGLLDEFGQRININIVIPSKDGSFSYSFKSGWMVYPDGIIKLVTVYGGKNK